MQKKIIALAIAALATPALALADATVYGQANLSVDMVNNGASSSQSNWQLNSNTSRLGVKGSEDLGGGNSFVFQAEGRLDMDKGNTFAFNRDTYIGLSNAGAGTLALGQHDTPYKMATRRLDLFGDGIADNRGNQSTSGTWNSSGSMMGGGHDTRVGNMIAYVSPNMSGFSVLAASVFGAETATSGTQKGSAYSLAGTYDQGPFYGALAYQEVKLGDAGTGDLAAGAAWDSALGLSQYGITTAAGDKSTAMKLGGGYTTEQFAINAVVEQIKSALASSGGDVKNTNYYISGKFNVSATDAVKLAYTKRGEHKGNGGGAGDAASQYTLGYDHSLSKATTVYALYTKLSVNGSVTDPITLVSTDNADPSAFSIGIKHSF